MQRFLFLLIVGFLLCDAAGMECLVFAERCTDLADTQPHGTCPPTCFRCACAQPIVPSAASVAATRDVLSPFSEAPAALFASAPLADILHVPKTSSLVL